MTLLVVLNDLSYPPLADLAARPLPPDQATAAVEELSGVIRAVRRHRKNIALVSAEKFVDLLHTVKLDWSGPRDADIRRYLKTLAAKAPFTAASDRFSFELEYEYEGQSAVGLGTAHMVDGLAVSLTLGSGWDRSWIGLTRRQYVESDDGSLQLSEGFVDTRHAGVAANLVAHQAWLADAGLEQVVAGPQLWEERENFFPHLRFLPGVQSQVRALRMPWLLSVRKLLTEFEEAVRTWEEDPRAGLQPTWPGLVTPEHETRSRDCWFDDPQTGERHLFNWHARFTPGAGRMHFRWAARERLVVVAHIGQKLGI